MINQGIPVERQCMFWVYIPAAVFSEGAYTSKKVAQNHKVVRKVCERAIKQDQISAVLAMRIEFLCKRRARILRIKAMNSFFTVGLKLLRSGVRSHGKSSQRFHLHKGFTTIEAVWWR